MKKWTSLTGAVSLAAAAMVFGGCASQNDNGLITSETFRHNPSPELYSLARSKVQFQNHQAQVIDLNTRQIPDDLSSLLFMNEPLHFSEYPTP